MQRGRSRLGPHASGTSHVDSTLELGRRHPALGAVNHMYARNSPAGSGSIVPRSQDHGDQVMGAVAHDGGDVEGVADLSVQRVPDCAV
ncbi:hypothetical protein AB0323_00280 [Arthrobacter sp. NPDC080031]|uniref:hypothetical protein n=1 Tax=Arthrobacter sp. NPDC080031 TaxID=3155918 RepID=UPI00344B10ED